VRPKGHNLVIISDSKIPGTMAVDALRDRGVQPISLNDAVIQKIDQISAGDWSRCNPICIRSELAPEMVEQIIACCLSVPDVDAILVILSPQFISDPEAFAGYLSAAMKRITVPVFIAWMGGDRIASARRILNHAGISTNETPERAVRAFMVLYNYELNQRLLREIPSLSADFSFDASAARKIIETASAGSPANFHHLNLLISFDYMVFLSMRNDFPVEKGRNPPERNGMPEGYSGIVCALKWGRK
jgi:acetyltransferase